MYFLRLCRRPAPGQGMTFEFTKDGKLRTHQGGRVVREGKYTVAAAKEASEIDFSLDDRNRKLRGVFAWRQDPAGRYVSTSFEPSRARRHTDNI